MTKNVRIIFSKDHFDIIADNVIVGRIDEDASEDSLVWLSEPNVTIRQAVTSWFHI